MALRKISEFKSQLAGGGARSNLFSVDLEFPTGITISDSTGVKTKGEFLVKSAALPASLITPVEVPFRGRILKLAGERTFDTWTITVVNDTDFKIRTAFEQWMNGISKLSDGTGAIDPAIYQVDGMKVNQLDRSGRILRSYKFYGIFPTNVSQIDLSMDTTDSIQEFTVELQVLYWELTSEGGGSAIA
jgi:hypothetical protein